MELLETNSNFHYCNLIIIGSLNWNDHLAWIDIIDQNANEIS